MGYTLTQINTVLSKADRAIHILGSVAYNKKFAELDETYWYDRDIIFLYKSAVEWGKVNDRVGTERMDWIVERLEAMMEIYDYGSLTPIYSQVAQVTGINTVNFLTEETDPTVPNWVKLITESNISNWNTAYGNRISSLTTTGTSGAATLIGNILNIPNYSGALTGYVPYVGATTNVDLGEFELKAGQFTLDVSPTGTAAVGTTRWNNTTGTSETTLKGGTVILKNGVDLVARVVNKVTPNATLTKAAYQAVRVSGAQGQRLAVSYAQADGDPNSADTIGLVTETIATNQEGFIMTVGQLEGINTTGSLQGETWTDGDVLYLSPTIPGAITNIKPSAPQHLVVMGYVEYAHANNGKIYVKIMNGWELGELHDVNTTGAVNGSVLKYNGTIWVPSSDTGITSLNGLTALSQAFATGTNGTDFNIASATATHTFNLPTASATNRGALSSADWTRFNNNIPAGTPSVGDYVFYNGSNLAYRGLIANAPLSYNSSTATFSISQATTSTDGYLSSTDWNTFNNKQPAGSYITALTGEATASGPGSATVTLSTSAVTGKLLTGLNLTGGGSIAATDSILQAFGKVQNQISGLAGGVTYQGTWNASTNTPTLTSSVGTKGYYYIVDVAGSTNLNGITDWKIGDWAIFNGSTWDKVDNTDAVSSVNGFTGAVSLTTANISEVTNLYYLDSRARAAISLTTTGTSGAATYDNTTGVLNIPQYQSVLTNPITGTGTSGQVAYFNGTNSITSNAAFAFTPTSQLLVNNSVTAASAIARGTNLTPTLTAAANNDVLVGLDINPTFTNGAFTGTQNIPIRVLTNVNKGTSYYIKNSSSGNAAVAGIDFLSDVAQGSFFATSSTYTSYGVLQSSSVGFYTTKRFAIAIDSATDPFVIGLGISPTEKFRINNNGNVGINQTTDAGFRLDVNGTARVQYGTTEQGFSMTHSNGTSSAIVLGNGSSATTGFVEFWRNGEYVAQYTSTYVLFRYANLRARSNTTLQLTGGIGYGATIGTSIRLQANTFDGGAFTATSGTQSTVVVGNSSNEIWSPSSGNATYNLFSVVPVINTSGTYSGIVRGYFYNPTLTSVTGVSHRAFENVSGDVLLGTTSGNVAIGTSTLATATELTLGGSQTASSAIARGQLLNTTLVAAANNDVLVGLDINPTFTNGAFTGVVNYGIRYNSSSAITPFYFQSTVNGTAYTTNTIGGNNNFTIASRDVLTATLNLLNGSNGASFYAYNNILTLDRIGTNSFIRILNQNVAINQNTDAGFRLDVNGTARVQSTLTVGTTAIISTEQAIISSNTAQQLRLFNTGTTAGTQAQLTFTTNSANTSSGIAAILLSTGNQTLSFLTPNAGTVVEKLRIWDTGNVLIQNGGTYTDSGFRFDVNGTARLQSTLTVGGTALISTEQAIISNNAAQQLRLYNSATTAGTQSQLTFTTNTNGAISSAISAISLDNSGNQTISILTPNAGTSGERLRVWNTGNVHIQNGGTYTDVASSILTMNSTTKGFLPPRMTAAQRTAISSPAEGLIVYQTDGTVGLYIYSGGSWKSLTMTTI